MKNEYNINLSKQRRRENQFQFRSLFLSNGLDSKKEESLKGLSHIDNILKENRSIYNRLKRKKPAKK